MTARQSFIQNLVETLKTPLLSNWPEARLWKQALGSVKWSIIDQAGSDVDQLRFLCSLALAYCLGGEFDQLERSPAVSKEEISRIYSKAADLVEDPELLPLLAPVTKRVENWSSQGPPQPVDRPSESPEKINSDGDQDSEDSDSTEAEIARAVREYMKKKRNKRQKIGESQPKTPATAPAVQITDVPPPSALAKDPKVAAGADALIAQLELKLSSMKSQLDSLAGSLVPQSPINNLLLPQPWGQSLIHGTSKATPVGQLADVQATVELRKPGQVYLPRCFTKEALEKRLQPSQAKVPQNAEDYIRASWEVKDLLEKEEGFVERDYNAFVRWIVELGDGYEWLSVMALDERLRSLQAVGKLRWKDRPLESLFTTLRARPIHQRAEAKQDNKPKAFSGTKKKKGVCFAFNGHKGCSKSSDACEYSHSCSDCKSSNHNVLHCSSGPKGHPGKTSSSGASAERRE